MQQKICNCGFDHDSVGSGVQRSGDAWGQQLDCMLPPKLSSTQECDKHRHFKYAKASVEKIISKNQTKYFRVYFVLMY